MNTGHDMTTTQISRLAQTTEHRLNHQIGLLNLNRAQAGPREVKLSNEFIEALDDYRKTLEAIRVLCGDDQRDMRRAA